MSKQNPVKLIPRNVAALRRGQSAEVAAQMVAGNPVSTRLESGVGNCFPGLECDLRNLERRFFPFLEVDIVGSAIMVVSVDLNGVRDSVSIGQTSAENAATYRKIASGLSKGEDWRVTEMQGTFGPLGALSFRVNQLDPPSSGPGRRPADPWTAVRLLTEDTPVELTLASGTQKLALKANRARYLDDNGALASMFLPGELTQSLCSPWTHDFRDCECFYWASNHPDIVKPLLPAPPPDTPEVDTLVLWERKAGSPDTLPKAATAGDPNDQMDHYEINQQWQSLNFVLEGREIVAPYSQGKFAGKKFATLDELKIQLQYAAGVELAVIHEYLAAAYSLRVKDVPAAMRDDVVAARAELMRIAYGEMRHVRAANDVLRALDPEKYAPALRVASDVPDKSPGTFRAVVRQAATAKAIQSFIDIESPSQSVDGLYTNILASLEEMGTDEMEQTIRSVMADGETHFETFRFIQEWLGGHDEKDYLRATAAPPAGNAAHAKLQTEYKALLELLFEGYTRGIPVGAADINAARNAMLGAAGLDGAADAVGDAGLLVVLDPIADPRFTPIAHP